MKLVIAALVSLFATVAAAHPGSHGNYPHSDYWQDDTCPPTGCIQ